MDMLPHGPFCFFQASKRKQQQQQVDEPAKEPTETPEVPDMVKKAAGRQKVTTPTTARKEMSPKNKKVSTLVMTPLVFTTNRLFSFPFSFPP